MFTSACSYGLLKGPSQVCVARVSLCQSWRLNNVLTQQCLALRLRTETYTQRPHLNTKAHNQALFSGIILPMTTYCVTFVTTLPGCWQKNYEFCDITEAVLTTPLRWFFQGDYVDTLLPRYLSNDKCRMSLHG